MIGELLRSGATHVATRAVKIFILVSVTASCACATVPMARSDLDRRAKDARPPSDAANVYVYRPSDLRGMAAKVQVFVDEMRIGALAAGTFGLVTLAPGEHKFVAHVTGSAEKTLVVEAGRSYYLKATPAWGWTGTNADLEEITDERSAQEDIHSCGLIADVAAEALRHVARKVAELNVERRGPEALLDEAKRALQMMNGGAPSPEDDLDSTLAQLREKRPGLDDRRILSIGAAAMVASLHEKKNDDSDRALESDCGLVLTHEGHWTTIAGVLPDSPAAVAHLERGLEVREVNGRETRDHTPDEVARLLAAPIGAEVYLTVGKPGQPDRKVTLSRAAEEKGAVDCRLLAKRVLYLRPWILGPSAARRVRDFGRISEASAGLVILDLRDTSRGRVDSARDLADSFLASGTIVSAEGPALAEADKTFTATPGTSEFERARVVVLVNGHTRGPAEALAAAIQDNRRGTILGSKTAGNGTIDVVRRISGMDLSLPVASLLRPSGEPIEGHGVMPDILDGTSQTLAPGSPISDETCPNVVSPGPVASDATVRRGVELLLTTPEK